MYEITHDAKQWIFSTFWSGILTDLTVSRDHFHAVANLPINFLNTCYCLYSLFIRAVHLVPHKPIGVFNCRNLFLGKQNLADYTIGLSLKVKMDIRDLRKKVLVGHPWGLINCNVANKIRYDIAGKLLWSTTQLAKMEGKAGFLSTQCLAILSNIETSLYKLVWGIGKNFNWFDTKC